MCHCSLTEAVGRVFQVNKAKSEYHAACKAERTALNQERYAANDTSLSAEAVRSTACSCSPSGRRYNAVQYLFPVSQNYNMAWVSEWKI